MLDIKSYSQIESYDDIKIFYRDISSKLKKLTDLQDEVVKKSEFWNKNRNLLIQSTAGTGKTLLSLIALFLNDKENRKMLYLVPYKALLNEKYIEFKQYFSHHNKIYRSSSDYFENDNDIFEGNCDIAIVIYEKLENYLQFNKDAGRIFSCYDLIIFDELSVVTTVNRGLKVHNIFRQFIKYASKSYGAKVARIIALTVPGCNIPLYEYLDFYTFTKYERQIKINETIYQADDQCFYPKDIDYVWPFEIKISCDDKFDFKNEWRICDEESDFDIINNRRILQQLVLKHRSLEHNLIIFCNSITACKGIAKYIADTIKDNHLPSGDWSSDLKSLEQELDDNAYGCIDNKLLNCSKYGVMIHNAELPNELRGRIEQEFSRRNGRSRINVLVSTETLAYGINCSADVVVVYNRSKITEPNDYPCRTSSYGDYYWRYINYIEYQNYIGRAGRLGFHENKSVGEREGFAYIFTRDENATHLVRKIYYEKDLGTINNCLQLFERKLKNNVHECIMEIFDYIDLNERQMFLKKDVEKAIYNLTGRNFIGKKENYIDVILTDMIKANLIEDEGDAEYSLTRQGEALRGKHIPYEAVILFRTMYYHLCAYGKYGFSYILYFFEMMELVEEAECNLVSRKKEVLTKFIRDCCLFVEEKHALGKINDVTKAYLMQQVENGKKLVDDLDIVNEEGFCYLSGELLKLLKKFTNAILLSEWCEGMLLKNINNKYNVRTSLGYIQKVTKGVTYLSDCFENYIKSMDSQSTLINELEKIKLEIKYGYPFYCIHASQMELAVSYRPFICSLLKADDKGVVEKILKEFVESDEFRLIHNSQKRIWVFKKLLRKYKGEGAYVGE